MTRSRTIPSPPPASNAADLHRPTDRPRTVYLDPHDLLDLPTHAQKPNHTEPSRDTASAVDLLASLRAQLPQVRADVRPAADAVLTWCDHQLRVDTSGLPDTLDAVLRPSPDPAALNLAALARDLANVTGHELTPKRLATALAHLRQAALAHAPSSASPTKHADNAQAEPPAALPASLRADPRPLALGLLAAVRQAVGRRTDRDYADDLPDPFADPVDPHALEADALNYLRASLPGRAHASPPPLHELLLILAPLTSPQAPAPTPTADRRLVLHAASAIAALRRPGLGPDALPAGLAHLNALVLLRDELAPPVYLAEMLRLVHAFDAIRQDPARAADTQALHRFAKRHGLPNPPGLTRAASYAAVNAATRLLQQLFDGQLAADTPIDAPPTWRDADEYDHQAPRAFPLATALLRRLETHDAGFLLTPTTRLLWHTVAVRVAGPSAHEDARQAAHQAALAHYQKLGPTKTAKRLADLAQHDNHDAMIAATAALAKQALPQLQLNQPS